jgi:hypothetical protein
VAHDDAVNSRHQATLSGMPRPPRATKSATSASEDHPDLDAIIAVWPKLSEAVRSLVANIVKAEIENCI